MKEINKYKIKTELEGDGFSRVTLLSTTEGRDICSQISSNFMLPIVQKEFEIMKEALIKHRKLILI
jgi:hypothetical protein